MKASFFAVLSLGYISSVVLAGPSSSSSYKLTPDPESQYFRLGACPDKHSCIFPPTESQFLTVRKDNGKWNDASKYFKLDQPSLENWQFNWTQSLEVEYAKILKNNAKPINVMLLLVSGVNSKSQERHSFHSDGTNTGAITAARAIARQHTSGKYHDLLSFEDFDELGHVITNSVDSLLTDSANSAAAYSSGHKSSVNCLNVYADSSPDPFDDPKVETITELIRRRQPKKSIGIVSTAYGQDATPAAFYSHTRKRSTSAEITDQLLHGVANWTSPVLPDVWLAGGAEYFSGKKSLKGTDYIAQLKKAGYKTVFNKKELKKYKDDEKLFGTFRQGNLDVWFERNLYVNNTVGNKAAPDNSGRDALGSDQPGLEDMTIKALEVLKKRGGKNGFFLMSEAASVDKKFHTFDYPRAFADLIELDVTIKKTVEWLKKNGEFEDTLIIFTADHAHAFDVYGSVNSEFMLKAKTEDEKISAIGVYQNAGFPGYYDEDGDGFPDNWTPKITLTSGTNNGPAHYEAWQISKNAPRYPSLTNDHGVVVPNPNDMAGNFGNGLLINNNLPHGTDQGVHSMSDVFVYSNGPGSELFKKTFENWELFFKWLMLWIYMINFNFNLFSFLF
ncbi:unnamed protein product [Cunninghamella echinulata]